MSSAPRTRSHSFVLCGVAFALLTLFAWMTTSVFHRVGMTYDELGHITTGYGYWKSQDYRVNAENGILSTRASAAPLLTMPLTFPPPESLFWKTCHARALGHEFFYLLNNPGDAMLRRARLGTLGFALGLLGLIGCWGTRLFGVTGGVIAAGLAAFSPTLLAHSGLATSDVILAFCLLAALTVWWRLAHRITWPRLFLAGLTAGLAFTAKMSGVILLPMLAMLLVLRCVRPAPLVIALGASERWLRSRGRRTAALLLAGSFAGVISITVIWAVYGFRYSATPEPRAEGLEFFTPWSDIVDGAPLSVGSRTQPTAPQASTSRPAIPRRVIGWAREHRLLPEAFLWGFGYTYHSLRERESFLNGEISRGGWPQFFPMAFLMKSTPAELALFLLGLVAVALLWRQRARGKSVRGRLLYRAAPLLVLFFIYWAVALATPLHIGHRHLLPVYPFVFVFAGAAALGVHAFHSRWIALVVAATCAWQIVDSLAARPFYLSYFTPFVGGMREGWRHLVDSSFDWGQGLPDLATWLDAKEKAGDRTPVFLTYFGSDSPRVRQLAVTRFADARDDHGPRRFPHLTGGWYAISATFYQKLYLHLAGPWTDAVERDYAEMARRLRVDAAVAATYTAEQKAALRALAMRYEVLQFGRLRHYLGDLEPQAVIGGSILLFRLSDADIQLAIDAPLAELNAHRWVQPPR